MSALNDMNLIPRSFYSPLVSHCLSLSFLALSLPLSLLQLLMMDAHHSHHAFALGLQYDPSPRADLQLNNFEQFASP